MGETGGNWANHLGDAFWDAGSFAIRGAVMWRMQVRSIAMMLGLMLLCAFPVNVLAIGWGPTDFLVAGGSNFNDKIGVFDQNLNFKGLLDSNFLGAAGMDFDAAGHLVVVSWAQNEVRVYDSTGARIGGFTKTDNSLSTSGALDVAIDGSYIVGQAAPNGARRFSPQGDFREQYSSGGMEQIAVVPGNKFWAGQLVSSQIRIFDINTGMEATPFSIAGIGGVAAMRYSAGTNTVLLGSGNVFEADLNGSLLRTFQAPSLMSFHDVTRGPDGDVFATTSSKTILRWHADASYVGSFSTSASIGGTGAIVWAGNAPEPSSLNLIIAPVLLCGRQVRGRRARG